MMARINLVPLVALALVLVSQCISVSLGVKRQHDDTNDDLDLPTKDQFRELFHLRVRIALLNLSPDENGLFAGRMSELFRNQDSYSDIYRHFLTSELDINKRQSNDVEMSAIVKSILAQMNDDPESQFGKIAHKLLDEFKETIRITCVWYDNYLKSQEETQDDLDLPTKDQFRELFHLRVRIALLNLSPDENGLFEGRMLQLIEKKDPYSDIYRHFLTSELDFDQSQSELVEMSAIVKSILAQMNDDPESQFGKIARKFLEELEEKIRKPIMWFGKDLKSWEEAREFAYKFTGLFVKTGTNSKLFDEFENEFTFGSDKNLKRIKVPDNADMLKVFAQFMDTNCDLIRGKRVEILSNSLKVLQILGSNFDKTKTEFNQERLARIVEMCQAWWDPNMNREIKAKLSSEAKN